MACVPAAVARRWPLSARHEGQGHGEGRVRERLAAIERALEVIGTTLEERTVCRELAEFLCPSLCEAAAVDVLAEDIAADRPHAHGPLTRLCTRPRRPPRRRGRRRRTVGGRPGRGPRHPYGHDRHRRRARHPSARTAPRPRPRLRRPRRRRFGRGLHRRRDRDAPLRGPPGRPPRRPRARLLLRAQRRAQPPARAARRTRQSAPQPGGRHPLPAGRRRRPRGRGLVRDRTPPLRPEPARRRGRDGPRTRRGRRHERLPFRAAVRGLRGPAPAPGAAPTRRHRRRAEPAAARPPA